MEQMYQMFGLGMGILLGLALVILGLVALFDKRYQTSNQPNNQDHGKD